MRGGWLRGVQQRGGRTGEDAWGTAARGTATWFGFLFEELTIPTKERWCLFARACLFPPAPPLPARSPSSLVLLHADAAASTAHWSPLHRLAQRHADAGFPTEHQIKQSD